LANKNRVASIPPKKPLRKASASRTHRIGGNDLLRLQEYYAQREHEQKMKLTAWLSWFSASPQKSERRDALRRTSEFLLEKTLWLDRLARH